MPVLFLLAVPIAVVGASEPCVVHVDGVRLGFNGRSGQWIDLALPADGPNLLGVPAGADLEVAGPGWVWPAQADWSAEPPQVDESPAGRRVSVRRRAGHWAVTTSYRVAPDSRRIARTATVEWGGPEPVKITGTAFRVPGVSVGGAEDAYWCLPGNYPVKERPVSPSESGRTTRERGWTWADTGCAYARSRTAGLGILACYELGFDHARVEVEEVGEGVSFVHRFDTVALLRPGDTLELGTQWIEVAIGGGDAFLHAAHALAAQASPGPPADRPEWLAGAVLEELHPWGRLESWGAGDRGNRMPAIEAQLPYLQELGVTGVWLLPVSNKPPWVYYLPQFRNIDPEVTTPEQLRSFIAAGHELGLKTLMDIVTYGISPGSPDVASLPEHVWCIDEQGERVKAWSGSVLSADCSDPDWRAHIVDLGSYWVREFGCDGFRLDCGGTGQSLNWRLNRGRRANEARMAGGIGQNALLRAAIRRINPEAILMPEAGATCHFLAGDLLFDYPFYMVCREMTRESDTARWVAQAREWLAAQQITHSPLQQASLVRFLENHDTVAAQEFWGVGPSQALTALCAFVPGVLLLHQEQEIGFAPELRTWLRLRRDLPELKAGRAVFDGVTAGDPLVMAFTRAGEDTAAIVAVNFGPAESECVLDWPDTLAGRLPICQDAVTGERLERGGAIRIPAYRPRVLTLRAAARAVPAAEARPAAGEGAGPLVIERRQEERPGGVVRHTIQLGPVSEWFIESPEGLLRDEFVDRHRAVNEGETHVDATPPLARCWRPYENRLWDEPGTGCFGAVAPDGRAVAIRFPDTGFLRAARLTDPSCLGKQAAFVIDVPPGSDAFDVAEYPDGEAYLAQLARKPYGSVDGFITVEPEWVKVSNGAYSAAFARRHGGALFGLEFPGESHSCLAFPAEVYTDWGLFEQGLHVASEWETTPQLDIERDDVATSITFRGHLRRPSWNGVAKGHIIEPPVAYRLTYTVDESPVIHVTLGVAATTDRPDTKAFLAYRIPFAPVEGWEAVGAGTPLDGRPGEHPGERVFQLAGPGVDRARAGMRLRVRGHTIRLCNFTGGPVAPDNPFLLDGNGGCMHLFFAMLNGAPFTLAAGQERTASFDLVME
ncbi:MAG: hypothetical protein JXR94_06095 [Candidatus Hydrogenedentes bacterium]|nr:hypothetical protein [Candidatus Hydrogenedentota bacterium]